jgi:hypothetical protein
LASARHIAAAAAPRAARMIGSDRRIPIAPITIPPAARLLIERLPAIV